MNKRSIRILEYNKVLEQLENYAVTEGAKRKVRNLKPRTERIVIEGLQQNTRDAFVRLEQFGQDVDNKFKVLHDITKNEVSKSRPSPDKGIPPQMKETIKQLKREGWTNEELAKRFNRTVTEIDLLLDLPD